MRRNLPKIPGSEVVWAGEIASQIEIVSDSFVLDKALVFPKAKDRPVVITALAAGSAVLLTLDRMDFHRVLGSEIYGMAVRTPADFMIEMRKKGEV